MRVHHETELREREFLDKSVHVRLDFRVPRKNVEEGRYKATWKRGFKLPWREAGTPKTSVDPDQ